MYELEHPHIVKLYNHFEDDRNFYLIMEYIPNGTILERLQKYSHFLEREAA